MVLHNILSDLNDIWNPKKIPVKIRKRKKWGWFISVKLTARESADMRKIIK